MDDRYQIIQRTSELPFGTQFEATDLLISRKAQIHRFANPGEDAPSDWQKRFDKGSGALTTLSHMGLPIIYDRGTNSAGPYLIRQLVNEPTLLSRLEEGPLSEYELWELAQQMLDIHSVGVSKKFFHGAILPDQICYATRPGGEKRYYMTCFGLAELHNQINGTEEYMGMPCLISLEQSAGEAPSEASEIFSIGQLLYLCLAENHPFASNDVGEMAELHKNYPLAPISSFRYDVPEGMVNWIFRMTAIDPNDRFSTYAEALENLPGPVNTAPIPVIPTATTFQQTAVPVGQTTAVQQAAVPVGQTTTVQLVTAAQTGTQAVSYAVNTQAVTANQAASQSGGAFKQILKEPLIVGGAVLALILVVAGIFVLSGGDDEEGSGKVKVSHGENSNYSYDSDRSGDSKSSKDPDSSKSSKSSDSSKASKSAVSPGSVSKSLGKGLIVALNFDSSLKAKNDSGISVENLKSSASYQEGFDGKGLLLDKDHYYKLLLKDRLPDGASSSFSISFWVKNLDQYEPAFISDKPWEGGSSRKLSGKDDSGFWQWTPENSFKQGGKSSSRKGWNMVSLVFSRSNNQMHVYSNGERIGESSTSIVESLGSEKYLYIGCDSRQKFNFTSPAIIDQLYIWDRKLTSKEILTLCEEAVTF